jgi:hypothetical protein
MTSVGRPKKEECDKAKPTDRIQCNICGGSFFRNNRSRHNNTKVHQFALKMNNDIKKLVLNDPDNTHSTFARHRIQDKLNIDIK